MGLKLELTITLKIEKNWTTEITYFADSIVISCEPVAANEEDDVRNTKILPQSRRC